MRYTIGQPIQFGKEPKPITRIAERCDQTPGPHLHIANPDDERCFTILPQDYHGS